MVLNLSDTYRILHLFSISLPTYIIKKNFNILLYWNWSFFFVNKYYYNYICVRTIGTCNSKKY